MNRFKATSSKVIKILHEVDLDSLQLYLVLLACNSNVTGLRKETLDISRGWHDKQDGSSERKKGVSGTNDIVEMNVEVEATA